MCHRAQSSGRPPQTLCAGQHRNWPRPSLTACHSVQKTVLSLYRRVHRETRNLDSQFQTSVRQYARSELDRCLRASPPASPCISGSLQPSSSLVCVYTLFLQVCRCKQPEYPPHRAPRASGPRAVGPVSPGHRHRLHSRGQGKQLSARVVWRRSQVDSHRTAALASCVRSQRTPPSSRLQAGCKAIMAPRKHPTWRLPPSPPSQPTATSSLKGVPSPTPRSLLQQRLPTAHRHRHSQQRQQLQRQQLQRQPLGQGMWCSRRCRIAKNRREPGHASAGGSPYTTCR